MKTILYASLTLLVCAFAAAREHVSDVEKSYVITQKLELRDAIDQVLRRNLGLKIKRFSPEISADNIIIEEAAHDWNFTSTIRSSKGVSPTSGTALDGALKPESVDRSYSASANKSRYFRGKMRGADRRIPNSSTSTPLNIVGSKKLEICAS